jgi:hypothetical protein
VDQRFSRKDFRGFRLKVESLQPLEGCVGVTSHRLTPGTGLVQAQMGLAGGGICFQGCSAMRVDIFSVGNFLSGSPILSRFPGKLIEELDRAKVGGVRWSQTARYFSGRKVDYDAPAACGMLLVSNSVLLKDSTNRLIARLHDIEQLIALLPDLEVSDDRDLVYALILLAKELPGDVRWEPDYFLTVPEVFIDVTRRIIESKRAANIICCPWAPEFVELPSWIPKRRCPRLSFARELSPTVYRASNLLCSEALIIFYTHNIFTYFLITF